MAYRPPAWGVIALPGATTAFTASVPSPPAGKVPQPALTAHAQGGERRPGVLTHMDAQAADREGGSGAPVPLHPDAWASRR